MAIEVRQVGIDFASRYGEVPIVLRVGSILEPESISAPGIVLHEVPCEKPYEKDYDPPVGDSDHPQRWAERWDTSYWSETVCWCTVTMTSSASIVLRSIQSS